MAGNPPEVKQTQSLHAFRDQRETTVGSVSGPHAGSVAGKDVDSAQSDKLWRMRDIRRCNTTIAANMYAFTQMITATAGANNKSPQITGIRYSA